MNVAELVELLKNAPQDALVCYSAEGGIGAISQFDVDDCEVSITEWRAGAQVERTYPGEVTLF